MIKTWQQFDNLRDNPRFQEAERRVGLEAFACFYSSATRIAERQGSDDLVCPAGAAEWASGVHARERAVFEFNLPVHENGIDPFG